MAQMRPPVLVIACGSRKIPTPAPARDLYVGSLFRAARAAAEADGRPWLICSAAHGLLTPDTVIAPYERALGSSRADIAGLAGLIAAQRPPPVVEAWTPRRYTAALAQAGVRIGAAPLAGLGIGHQLAWLTQHRTHPHHRTRERHPMTTGEPHLLHVAPGELITTTNVRADLNLDDEFLASIRAQGVLVPIVATRTDSGQLAIEYGHRRAAAAAEVGLGTVPVVVMPAADTHAARVMAQMTENDRRAALSTEEKLAAHEQLAILGVTVADVARTTGTDQATVKAARKVATDPTARAAAAAGLDLADALVLGEFADDPEFVTELAEVALDEGRDYMLRAAERRRQEIALEQALAGEEQNWRDQGYQIVDPASSDHSVAPMWRILNDAGDSITDQDHADCPGRAVKVSGWRIDMIKATHYCIDPDEHHPNQVQVRNTWSSTPTPEPDQAAKSAERARVITHNKDWRASEPIRRQHVRDWLAGAKPTPAITRWLLGELIDPRADQGTPPDPHRPGRAQMGCRCAPPGHRGNRAPLRPSPRHPATAAHRQPTQGTDGVPGVAVGRSGGQHLHRVMAQRQRQHHPLPGVPRGTHRLPAGHSRAAGRRSQHQRSGPPPRGGRHRRGPRRPERLRRGPAGHRPPRR